MHIFDSEKSKLKRKKKIKYDDIYPVWKFSSTKSAVSIHRAGILWDMKMRTAIIKMMKRVSQSRSWRRHESLVRFIRRSPSSTTWQASLPPGDGIVRHYIQYIPCTIPRFSDSIYSLYHLIFFFSLLFHISSSYIRAILLICPDAT